jgi:D-beta-D-heptose 7-phosphate kinase/D-beta-D-heptose 1-phosphate adenosyltransferase
VSEPAGIELVDLIAGLRILVLGEAMLDSYVGGETTRLSREAPVPIVDVRERRDVPGGAGNAAANLASLGAQPVLLSVIGADHDGLLLRRALERCNVCSGGVLAAVDRATLTKTRVVSGGQIVLRFDEGTCEPIDAETERELCNMLGLEAQTCDAIVVSDYGHGVLTPAVIGTLAEIQRESPHVLVVDAKRPDRYAACDVHAGKPSWDVAAGLLGIDVAAPQRPAVAAARGRELLELLGARAAAITLDGEGVVLVERDAEPYRIYARRAPSGQTAGAGDTFTVAFAAALAAGAGTPAAAELAAAAASVTVESPGTTTCSAAELRERLGGGAKVAPDRVALSAELERLRRLGRRIVLTSGCFDILHRGHVTYLSHAKALGDVLVVGVNTDDGVARLKGPERPLNPLEDRLQVLAALSCVDHVIAFDEDTPVELVEALRPDVFTKGGDYTRESLLETEAVERNGGTVMILPYVVDRSTTRLITRAADACDASACSGRGPAVDGLAERDPSSRDGELTYLCGIPDRTGLEDGARATDARAVAEVLEQQHVVREMRDAVVGQARDGEEIRQLERHEGRDAGTREALGQRVHVLAESRHVARGELQIGEAVDQHPTRPAPLDRVEQCIDPLVDLNVDG